MRYVIENNEIYTIKDNKMVGVDISLTEIKMVGPEKVLPKEYNSYSEDEIIKKFQITKENPYKFNNEETPKKVGGRKNGNSNSK